jgi:dolichyl-phosphate beta-glucosyltransferase
MSAAIVVIPCFNEAPRLPRTAVEQMLTFCQVVLVDDGSTDNTSQVLRDIAADHSSRCKALILPRNVGKGEAVRAGLLEAANWAGKQDAIIGYTDADFATPPSEMRRLLALFQHEPQLHAVFGSRLLRLGADIERNTTRHYLGRVFATVASRAIDAPVYDSQCGAKWFRMSGEMLSALEAPFRSRWAFDVELISRLTRRGLSFGAGASRQIREEMLNEWTDVAGSKVKPLAAIKAGLELLLIGVDHRRGRG